MSEAGRTGATAVAGVRARPAQINALQAAWLREIGLPRALMPHVAAQAPSRVSQADSSRTAPAAAHVVDTAMPTRPQEARSVSASSTPAGAAKLHDAPAPAVKPARPGAFARPQPAVQSPVFVAIARDPAEIEGADLHSLREQVSGCGACALSASRQHAVFGSGATPARWMIVGEAPGEQEDVQGLPFVGKSGELLNEMLRAAGIDRERDVFVANVIKCRPPGNRNPRPDEIDACKPFLLRQIQLVQPECLLVVGRFAAQVLLASSANLNSLRGRIHEFDDGAGRMVPLVVSYHPAYLLRSPQEKARAWRDLALATQAAKAAEALVRTDASAAGA